MAQKLSEDAIQAQYHKWLWNTYPATRGLCYHIANGGTRGAISQTQIIDAAKLCRTVSELVPKLISLIKLRAGMEGNKLKSAGVIEGIPDYHHAIPNEEYASLYIEFKEPEANMNADHVKTQLRRHEQLRRAGNMVCICKSVEQAQSVALNYLPVTYLHKALSKV